MNRAVGWLSAAGIGAGLMYVFDPDRGRRRRGVLLNKARHANKIVAQASGKTGRDLQNHLVGVFSEIATLFRTESVPDNVLEARVRAKLGRVVSHPRAIEVKAGAGLVILGGPILSEEVHPLLNAVVGIPGVKNIESRLEIHDNADIPALQGGTRRTGQRFGPFKTTWSPTTRLIAGMAGGALTLYGGKRRGVLGPFISSLGLGIVTRALTNVESRKFVGLDGSVRGIEVEKTITVKAPVDEVFTYWSHPENFPEFMSHVKEVNRISDGVYHWKVGGPGGLLVEWDAAITDLDFNKLLAWKSLPGAVVSQDGITRFTSNPDGSTRIDVKMSYQPPAGILGHAMAELFGVDPKQEMDDDLMRMKSFIETGVHPHDAACQFSRAQAPIT
jgi:uncharacterized membrane protein